MQVRVTSHPASKHDPVPLHDSAACPQEASQLRQQAGSNGSHSKEELQEWRVLRFNEETVQSVARVSIGSSEGLGVTAQQRPDCMAFLYMKTIGAAGSLQVLHLKTNKPSHIYCASLKGAVIADDCPCMEGFRFSYPMFCILAYISTLMEFVIQPLLEIIQVGSELRQCIVARIAVNRINCSCSCLAGWIGSRRLLP